MRTIQFIAAILALALLTPVLRADDKYKNIDGVVRDDSKNTISDVDVRLMKRMGEDRDLHEIASTKTDKHGKFHFDKIAIGTYVVDVKKGDLHAMRHIDLSLEKLDTATLEIGIHRGPDQPDVVQGKDTGYTSIDGIVRSADKQPIKGAAVRLLGTKKGTDKLKEIDKTTTDANGYFQFYKVLDGTFTIEVNNGKHTTSRQVTIKNGEKMDRLEFTFKD